MKFGIFRNVNNLNFKNSHSNTNIIPLQCHKKQNYDWTALNKCATTKGLHGQKLLRNRIKKLNSGQLPKELPMVFVDGVRK